MSKGIIQIVYCYYLLLFIPIYDIYLFVINDLNYYVSMVKTLLVRYCIVLFIYLLCFRQLYQKLRLILCEYKRQNNYITIARRTQLNNASFLPSLDLKNTIDPGIRNPPTHNMFKSRLKTCLKHQQFRNIFFKARETSMK
jgi:hypothetical protein